MLRGGQGGHSVGAFNCSAREESRRSHLIGNRGKRENSLLPEISSSNRAGYPRYEKKPQSPFGSLLGSRGDGGKEAQWRYKQRGSGDLILPPM